MKDDILNNFRSSLFWDTNKEELDLSEDSRFIIGRVLDFGNIDEWKLIEKKYGRKKIAEVAKNHVFTNSRSANFWSLVLSISSKKLKCTRKPSLKTPKAFLNR